MVVSKVMAAGVVNKVAAANKVVVRVVNRVVVVSKAAAVNKVAVAAN